MLVQTPKHLCARYGWLKRRLAEEIQDETSWQSQHFETVRTMSQARRYSARLARASRPALPVLRRTSETDVAQFRLLCTSAFRFVSRIAKCFASSVSFEIRLWMSLWGQRLAALVVLVLVATVLLWWCGGRRAIAVAVPSPSPPRGRSRVGAVAQ